MESLLHNLVNLKATVAVLLATGVLVSSPPYSLAAQSERADSKAAKLSDAHQRLKEIEERRQKTREHVRELRKKEQIAMSTLHKIQQNLNETKDTLNKTQKKIVKTETKINECEVKITQTKSQEQISSEQACQRLREIYEGQRLGLLEMLFQVNSLQSMIDLLYYQERVAEMDRKLLDTLRAKAEALAAKRNQLGSQKNFLGDLVSEFTKKALKLNRQKDTQEQIADRLRSQRAFYEQAERQLAQESLQLERQIVSMCNVKGRKNMTQGSGQMSMPLHAPVTSPFGWRRHPIFGVRKFHTGVDLAGPNHSQIKAADSGNVLYAGHYGGYGRVVILSHGKGMATLYAHMSKTAVSPGENVHKGQVIGYEGSTGFSTGPHLHFEVRVDGKPSNPLGFVR